MVEIVIEKGAFLGVDWQAASALATLLLVIGAGFAAVQVGRQLRQAERHQIRLVRAMLRPMLVAQGDVITAKSFPPVANVGVGPALSIRGKAWVVVMQPPPLATPFPEATVEIETAVGNVTSEPHHVEIQVSAIAAGGESGEWHPAPGGPQLIRDYSFVFHYDLEYEDVDGYGYRTEASCTGAIQ